jgi:hypothetical protein
MERKGLKFSLHETGTTVGPSIGVRINVSAQLRLKRGNKWRLEEGF